MDAQPTILIVDDTKTNLDILLELLSEKYAVVPALDGKTALEILEKIDVDLILSDIVMPELDGFELCEKLKSNPNTKDIPVMFITAKDDGESIQKAYDMGGIDIITKPFESELVMHEVGFILDDVA